MTIGAFRALSLYIISNNMKTTRELAEMRIHGELDWNKLQHFYGISEQKALELIQGFCCAVYEEWDKNLDYYNQHQNELLDKFHHLLSLNN